MERRTVESGTIESIGYDPTSAVLEIKFRHGEIYEYFMVPPSTYLGLCTATSKGRFFGEFVRGRYQFRKEWAN